MVKVQVAKESVAGWAKDVNLSFQKVQIVRSTPSSTEKGKEKKIEILFATDSQGNEILLSNSMFTAEVRKQLQITVAEDGTFELNKINIQIEGGKITKAGKATKVKPVVEEDDDDF